MATRVIASLEQVLLWYDGPQILLLRVPNTLFVIAVAATDKLGNDLFLGALVTPRQLVQYQAENFDLRFLMLRAHRSAWYQFELSDDEEEIKLTRIKRDAELIRDFIPEAGLFSRAHEPIKTVSLAAPSAVEKFDIDGSWNLGEFSSFYGQVEDVYYIFNTVDRYYNNNTSIDEKLKLQEAFLRPWRGGGSYLGFYGQIANDNDQESQLRVSGIQYHSPGYVEVRARQKPFDDLINLIARFSNDPMPARKAYRNLYSFMAKAKLLKASPDSFLSQDYQDAIRSLAEDLSGSLGAVDFIHIEHMARENVLVTAKVFLSLHRRVERLNGFFAQGRVKHDRVENNVQATMIDG
ncbi:hypothetical protein [Sphingomonas sp. BAUL-RG-20F-R05-02]|uniref:hypothetical protein n=1 Tax=Sphingomonas sp. BAUL-RG-20F-R05-02 TaxID=2914830 RepID=UPI001F5984A5|nr:hypothetical protein [Sphingomonas sp. BAUL-RG-20F-R05-02]